MAHGRKPKYHIDSRCADIKENKDMTQSAVWVKNKKVKVHIDGRDRIFDIATINYDADGNIENLVTKAICEPEFMLKMDVYGGLALKAGDKFEVIN